MRCGLESDPAGRGALLARCIPIPGFLVSSPHSHHSDSRHPGPALSTLDRLGAALADRYALDRELGAGGMATVYLAHDLKHDRKVAIKVLRPELAAVIGAERFLAEIKTTANLQHPHILPLFDSGVAKVPSIIDDRSSIIHHPASDHDRSSTIHHPSSSFLFYVMPYVEGISLRDRMTREKQLPIVEAVRIATEIAAALDYAHRHGVIHRDIKPENILLHDGSALVADFGIALAASKAGTRMTETGMSLGTPQYMSPEQAMGERELDARSDVYALGCVTYEMLTGEPPFSGPTAQAIVAKVMTAEPANATSLRKTIPEHVADAVHTALQKLPADRFATAAEFSSALGHAGATSARRTTGLRAASAVPRWQRAVPWALAVVLLGAAAWGWFRPEAPAPVIRYGLALPTSQAMTPGAETPALAPDGSFLVYSGPGEDGGSQLWLKRRESYAATPIAGTAGVQSFTVSPDGGSIAFIANGRLSKIPVGGGPAVLLASDSVGGSFGVAWLDDGTIVFPQRGAIALRRVSATGGSSSVLWRSDTLLTLSPNALPGHHGVLFVACSPGCPGSELWAIDASGANPHLLVRGATAGSFVAPDQLVYSTDDGGLFTVQFNLKQLKVTGTAVPLSERIWNEGGLQRFRISASGTLLVQIGGATAGRSFEMVWVDRSGKETAVDSTWKFRLTALANNHGWALSPDESRLAIGLSTSAGDDIWVKPLPTGAPYRVSFDALPDLRPRWTADNRYITFVGVRRPGGIYRHRADGSGADSLLLAGTLDEGVISPDGSWLVLRQGSVGNVSGGRNINGLRLGLDSVSRPILATEFDEEAVALSPNGQWMAYQSDETGRTEVFVKPFPNTDNWKRQVSSGGGVAPLWSRDGKELFYLSNTKAMMAVPVTAGTEIGLGTPTVLFRVRPELLGVEANWYTPWDVARDGRFLMARLVSSTEDQSGATVLVENWIQELRAKAKR